MGGRGDTENLVENVFLRRASGSGGREEVVHELHEFHEAALPLPFWKGLSRRDPKPEPGTQSNSD